MREGKVQPVDRRKDHRTELDEFHQTGTSECLGVAGKGKLNSQQRNPRYIVKFSLNQWITQNRFIGEKPSSRVERNIFPATAPAKSQLNKAKN